MIIIHKLQVNSARASLESAPPFVAGTAEAVWVEVAFDPSWEKYTKNLFAARQGEDVRWELPLDETGRAVLPAPLTQSAVPLYLWAEGTCDGEVLRSNSVCISPEPLCLGEEEEPAVRNSVQVYPHSYRATANGVYPTKNFFLTENFTVDVPPLAVDTARDTVTPQTMLEGITAHDASACPIVGTIPTYRGEEPAVMSSPKGLVLPTKETYCDKNLTVVPLLQTLDAKENGVYLPADGFAGIGAVSVDVQPLLQVKTARESGTVTPDAGYYGLSRVEVDVQPLLQAKTVSANGTVTADWGYDGLSQVVVQVPARGIGVDSRALGEIVHPQQIFARTAVIINTISAVSLARVESK